MSYINVSNPDLHLQEAQKRAVEFAEMFTSTFGEDVYADTLVWLSEIIIDSKKELIARNLEEIAKAEHFVKMFSSKISEIKPKV